MQVLLAMLLNVVGIAQTVKQSPLEYWIGGATEEVCRKTRGGCYCKEQWPYKGSLLSGCQRPDDDPHGPWCVIDQNDPFCTFDPNDDTHKVITEQGNFTGDYWQYCNSYYCPHGSGVQQKKTSFCDGTSAGCSCKQRWSYSGKDGYLYNDYGGCANPDNDALGEWCVVEPGSCVNTPPAQRQAVVQFKNIEGGTWDRCECRESGPPAGKTSSSSANGIKSAFLFNLTVDDNCDPGVVPSCMRR